MQSASSILELSSALNLLRKKEASVGFVPTMGALHDGHMSLIRRSVEEADITVVSAFVNPTQFGPSEDFDTYPRQLERDRDLCAKAGVDVFFVPTPAEMYPAGYATYVLQERYTEPFEGELRTGHFHGVCTVCTKLFNLVQPHVAYFGQKDYQQSVVVRRMVRDLNLKIEIRICPIIREPDGLAVSSRNVYLSPDERAQATSLHRSLGTAEELFAQGERRAVSILAAMEKVFDDAPLAKVDYLAIVNPDSLREIRRIESEAVALVAVRLGKTRLIDNARLTTR